MLIAWTKIAKAVRVRRRLSVANKTISRWVRWDKNKSKEIEGARGRREGIASGRLRLSLAYKTNAI